jgi:hypothetical protein
LNRTLLNLLNPLYQLNLDQRISKSPMKGLQVSHMPRARRVRARRTRRAAPAE